MIKKPTIRDIDNLRRKIRRARKPETLARYQAMLDAWIIELDTSIAATQARFEKIRTRPYFRHNYNYDMFDERLRAIRFRREFIANI